jgi:EAL domain-containing protein (putative c-di-GMP-specific phosphodiesterase class I)
MGRAADEFLAMESDLRRAIPEGQLRLLYQPIVDRDGRLRGVEALVRWQHPVRGLLAPDTFLPLAATAGLASAIDYWVLETACSQAVAWRQAGLDLQVAVNLSANLFESSRLPANVDRLLRRLGLAPEKLELEITEQVAMKDIEAGNAVIDRLRRVGVRVALDDFGTGYSSMSWLRGLPVDRIKIDRSFTRDLESRVGHAIVRSMIELAHAMELEVTAEGVESSGQFEHLRRLSCDHYQGFLFSRPMTADTIPEFDRSVESG